MPRGVACQIDIGLARVRPAAPAVPLVEENKAIGNWIKEPAVPAGAAGTGATVEDQRRPAARVAERLPVDEVAVGSIKHPMFIRLDVWVKVCEVSCHVVPRRRSV